MSLDQLADVLQDFRKKLKHNRIPVQMLEIFLIIQAKPGLTQKDIKDRTGMQSDMSITRSVTTLVEKGLVYRADSDKVSHGYALHLTREGKAFADSVRKRLYD